MIRSALIAALLTLSLTAVATQGEGLAWREIV